AEGCDGRPRWMGPANWRPGGLASHARASTAEGVETRGPSGDTLAIIGASLEGMQVEAQAPDI
ncbi:unnamed protein product, partial [Prorocentrum cordatum]